MAGDCTHVNAWSDGEMESAGMSRGAANFEVIDGQLYRKKLERGFINYREVLDEERRQEALSTFHRRQPGQRHLSLEETYKSVAENYWWEGMYFQIRDFVLGCPDCQSQHNKTTKESGGRRRVTKTMASHGADTLSKLRSQREAGLFCDITLRTGSSSYQAHRAVLAAVSDHFQEIFTGMDMNMKADLDLTGFSEDTLVSLLDFSYSSTLCVRPEDLPEVTALARHLGMWPALEACTALMKEQERQLHPRRGYGSACAALCQERHKGHKDLELEDDMNSSFHLTLDASDESLEGTPRRNLRRTPKSQGHNGLPMSPSHRMKLMDFKSPSSKKAATPQHAIAPAKSQSYSPVSPSSTRLLRSSPGAANEVPRLFPMPVTPRRNKKPHSIPRLSCPSRLSPVRVKQEPEEVGDDESDYARAQEKYKLMYVLGLQRTALLPRPEDLIGWRQKKRLRKLKANNYSLTKRRKPRPASSPGLPYADMTLSLPLCTPVNALLLNKSAKAKPPGRGAEPPPAKKRKSIRRKVPPSDRSMRSKGALPDMFGPSYGGRELRRRRSDAAHLPARPPPRRTPTKPQILRPMVQIKEEPDEYCISGLGPPANNGGFMSYNPPPSLRTQPQNKAAAETVKTLRYNSGRPAAKAKLRRGAAREADKTKCVGGLRGVLEPGPRVKFNQPDGLQFSEHAPPPPSIYGHPLYKAIKKEPADPIPVAPFQEPTSPDLGKRQSKPPIKLLDSGFLFSFCRPAAGAMAVLKKEEESVDICLTRSVSQVGDRFGVEQPSHRALRARGPPGHPVVKREREERSVSQPRLQRPRPANPRNNALHPARAAKSKTPASMPKHVQQQARLPLSSRSCVMLDAVRRARLKQLRGPRSQAPKAPKSAHACPQCSASYKDCDALTMHRLRHIEGKHWPCPLCCKTFFRLRNVRNHIRTHDPKLYKCRSCIAAGS